MRERERRGGVQRMVVRVEAGSGGGEKAGGGGMEGGREETALSTVVAGE